MSTTYTHSAPRKRTGPEHRLSPEIVAELCRWAAQARTVADWARKLGVTSTCVNDAIARGSGKLTRYERAKFKRAGIDPDTVQP